MIAVRGYLAGACLLLALILSASAETLHVAGAGSLTAAFTDLLRRFPSAPDTVAPPALCCGMCLVYRVPSTRRALGNSRILRFVLPEVMAIAP
jgi:hypothetical protein